MVIDYRNLQDLPQEKVADILQERHKYLALSSAVALGLPAVGSSEIDELERPKRMSTVKALIHNCQYVAIEDEMPKAAWAEALHDLLDEPTSSKAAMAMNVFITLSIVTSFVLMLLEHIVCKYGNEGKECREGDGFVIADYVVSSIFSVEWVARFVAAVGLGNHVIFLKDYSNIFDLMAVLPMWFSIIFNNSSGAFLVALRVLRFLKLARIIRLMRVGRTFEIFGMGAGDLVDVVTACAVVFLVIWTIFMKESFADESS
jgi:hypothetical protein